MKQLQLKYFLEVIQQNSFTRAAENLFISQSTLSKSIKTLENELGVTLFIREPRNLKLTDEGKMFYNYAKDILDYCISRTEVFRTALDLKKNTLRFGLPPSAGNVCFSKIIYQYTNKYPAVNLRIFEEKSKKIETMILNGELDLGVIVEPYQNDEVELKSVFRSEAVLAVSNHHRLAKRRQVAFRELKDEPFLLVSKDYMYYDQVIKHCLAAGFSPKIAFTSSQWDVLLEMAAENVGITIIGKPLVEKMYSDRLASVHVTEPEFPWGLGVIYKKGNVITKPMKLFLALCDEC